MLALCSAGAPYEALKGVVADGPCPPTRSCGWRGQRRAVPHSERQGRAAAAGTRADQGRLQRAQEDVLARAFLHVQLEWLVKLRRWSGGRSAGLRTGDSLVAFGAVQHATFESVTASVVPVVKARVGREIDCVVVRLDEAAKVHQIALTLIPQKWEGSGLLGCILK